MDLDSLWRPRIHFTPRCNWMNDPCGLIYRKGLYHLFYQHNPEKPAWGNIHWGHAVSRNLFDWKDLPAALEPDSVQGMPFTGSCVYDTNNSSGLFSVGESSSGIVAVFTSAVATADPAFPFQEQVVASSTDAIRWKRYGKTVLANGGHRDFRDPKVFFDKQSCRWVMVVSCGKEVRFYSSLNLTSWEYLSSFSNDSQAVENVLECPELLQPGEGENWFLVVNDQKRVAGRGATSRYFAGRFDGTRFKVDTKQQYPSRAVDCGHDFYAAQSWANLPDKQNRTVWIGWASHHAYGDRLPTATWKGVLTLPREVFLLKDKNQVLLGQKPVAELAQYRGDTLLPEIRKQKFLRFSINREGALEFYLDLPPQCHLSVTLGFTSGEDVVIEVDPIRNCMTVDRTRAGMERYHHGFQTCSRVELPGLYYKLPENDFRLIWDYSIVECFIAGGLMVSTSLVFVPSPLSKIEVKTNSDCDIREARLVDLKDAKRNTGKADCL